MLELGRGVARTGGDVVFAVIYKRCSPAKDFATGAYFERTPRRKTILYRKKDARSFRLGGLNFSVPRPKTARHRCHRAAGLFVAIRGVSGGFFFPGLHARWSIRYSIGGARVRHARRIGETAGLCELRGRFLREIVRVTQSPLSRHAAAQCALYLGAFDSIRDIFEGTG